MKGSKDEEDKNEIKMEEVRLCKTVSRIGRSKVRSEG